MNFIYSDFEAVKNAALQFSGAEESVSHNGTPSIKVNGKLMCRLHEDGTFVPIRLGFEQRDLYLEKYPEIFHLPEHYRNYPYVCFWLPLCDKKLLDEILEISWKLLATKKQISDWERDSIRRN